jgi:hypothetical protein
MMWALLMPWVLKLVGVGLDRMQANQDAKRRFLEFVDAMAAQQGSAGRIYQDFKAARAKLFAVELPKDPGGGP